MALASHGISKDSAQNLLFSAGAIYKNLKYDSTKNEWSGEVLGATKGGIKLSITPEYVDAEMDGASVSIVGTRVKVSEKATIESSMTEFSEGVIKDSLHLELDGKANINGYKKYVSKRSVEEKDYLDNIAYVGTLVNGKQIIVILPNAICTSALEIQGQNKTQATYTITFECTARFTQSDLEHLPYEIYYPQTDADTKNQGDSGTTSQNTGGQGNTDKVNQGTDNK